MKRRWIQSLSICMKLLQSVDEYKYKSGMRFDSSTFSFYFTYSPLTFKRNQ